MNVKCPKCRFRFDVPASPGMTELQCNCPRCGTPFTYNVEDSDDVEGLSSAQKLVDETAQEDRQPSHETGSEPSDFEEIAAADFSYGMPREPETEQSGFGSVPPPIPPYGFAAPHTPNFPRQDPALRPSQNTHPSDKDRKKTGCLKRFAIISACIVVGIVFLLRHCDSSKSYDANSVGLVNGDGIYTDSEQVTAPTPSYDEHKEQESAPEWIQGNWHVNTDYGGISLKIYGENIAETSGGETSYGRFKYQNDRLYCDFGDSQTFVYRLVRETQQIDAGNGLLMKKIE